MSGNLRRTPEQDAIVGAMSAALPGSTIAVEAVAGSGKTTTLEMVAQKLRLERKSITYLAFNAPLAKKMNARFGRMGATVKTLHAAAFASVFDRSHPYSASRRKPEPLRGVEICDAVNVEGYRHLPGHIISSRGVAAMVARTIERFCQSDEVEIKPQHVTLNNYHRMLKSPELSVRDAARDLARYVFSKALVAWARIQDPNGDLPISHSVYPKLFHQELLRVAAGGTPRLSVPRYLAPDVFLVDEAQDLNPVQIDTVRLLAERSGGSVTGLVGDSYQQIYAWRGAINALSRVRADVRLPLTQSFRFGPAIAELATEFVRLHEGREDFLVRGTPGKNSVIRPITGYENAILTRTNIGAFNEAIAFMNYGRPVHLMKAAEIRSEIEDIITLRDGGAPRPYSEYAPFLNFNELVEYAEHENRPLKRLIDLLEDYEDEDLLSILDACKKPQQGAVDVCTAHSAKGKEWPMVRLGDDFPLPPDPDDLVAKPYEEERNLAYVAITRAQDVLDPSAAPHIMDLVPDPSEAREEEPPLPEPLPSCEALAEGMEESLRGNRDPWPRNPPQAPVQSDLFDAFGPNPLTPPDH